MGSYPYNQSDVPVRPTSIQTDLMFVEPIGGGIVDSKCAQRSFSDLLFDSIPLKKGQADLMVVTAPEFDALKIRRMTLYCQAPRLRCFQFRVHQGAQIYHERAERFGVGEIANLDFKDAYGGDAVGLPEGFGDRLLLVIHLISEPFPKAARVKSK